MSTAYVGEVRLVGFNFAPVDWALCNGAAQSISQNPTLFNLIGTTYGGDGQNTFNLPDLRGRTPIHQGPLAGGSTYTIGQIAGAESVTITINTYPQHSHTLLASTNPGGQNGAANNVTGQNKIYGTPASSAMNAAVLLPSNGGSQPHDNLQPYVVLNWIISLFGVYPSAS